MERAAPAVRGDQGIDERVGQNSSDPQLERRWGGGEKGMKKGKENEIPVSKASRGAKSPSRLVKSSKRWREKVHQIVLND